MLVPSPSSYPEPPTCATLPLQRLTGGLFRVWGLGKCQPSTSLACQDTDQLPTPLFPSPNMEGWLYWEYTVYCQTDYG